MTLICVGGAWSGIGKTSVVELLLRALPGWAAIKVTPSRPEEVCPLGNCCGACAAPEGPYELITDPRILRDPGKDTDRYLKAGACEVVWIRALPEVLPEALEAALATFSGPPGVVIESTTLVPHVEGLRVVVASSTSALVKDSVRGCAGTVDLLAVNQMDAVDRGPDHPLAELLGAPVSVPVRADRSPEDPLNAAFLALVRARLATLNA